MLDPTLLFLLVIPVLGAIVCATLHHASVARSWALLVCIATAVVAAVCIGRFDFKQDLSREQEELRPAKSIQLWFGPERKFRSPSEEPPRAMTRMERYQSRFRFQAATETTDWNLGIESIGFNFALGVDSISLWLIALTALLMPAAIAGSFGSIVTREKEYYTWMLLLLAAMMGAFAARDLLLFYVFFELTLVPMFFIIGIWGGPQRRWAAGKFFLFTFAGSVFALAVVIYLGVRYGTFDIATLIEASRHGLRGGSIAALSDAERWWVALGLLVGFAVKVPLFPLHTWLPLAHTEAPTAGSVILAGVLLKLGTYGLLRLALPLGLLGPEGVAFPGLLRLLGVLCIIGVIYGALVAWVQQDIKKLVAYSSVSHLGFCVLGMVALNDVGLQGSVLYMINHGLSTGAMFLVVGMIYERFHTRDINALSGLAKTMPVMAFFFVFFTLSSIGLPGLNGFVSEFLTILGAFTSKHLGMAYGVTAAVGVILGAVYMLHMVAKVIWGPLKVPAHGGDGREHSHADGPVAKNDISLREISLLVPLAAAVIYLGVMPARLVMPSLEAPLRIIQQPLNDASSAAIDASPEHQPKIALAQP